MAREKHTEDLGKSNSYPIAGKKLGDFLPTTWVILEKDFELKMRMQTQWHSESSFVKSCVENSVTLFPDHWFTETVSQ